MTPQEAIKFLNETKVGCKLLKDRQLMNVCDTAISALEKQIPKKTLPTSDDIFEFGNCPNCGAEFNSELICEYEIQCCPYCGQALDWGEGE